MLPEVVGNLMTQHIALSKMNTAFYKEHPEFTEKKQIVASIVEKIEGENPLMKYEDLLVKAVPEIRRRIQDTKGLDATKASPVIDLNFKKLETSGNGEI
jgi:hypothetical protein